MYPSSLAERPISSFTMKGSSTSSGPQKMRYASVAARTVPPNQRGVGRDVADPLFDLPAHRGRLLVLRRGPPGRAHEDQAGDRDRESEPVDQERVAGPAVERGDQPAAEGGPP